MAGRKTSLESYREGHWQEMAVLCRYGHLGLNDAMAMPRSDAEELTKAILKLVTEENRNPNGD